MDQARADARTQAMTALASDHQTAINTVLNRVKGGQITDVHDAARQIDALLTAKESQAVLAARDKMMADMRASRPPDGAMGPGPSSGGPGSGPEPGGFGPGQSGGPPGEGGRRRGGQAMRNDAGSVLLMLNLDHDQMRSLFENSRPAR